MANLIKKIKIKKQDGTFTDYIPIGAEAENVNVDGESVEVKLNKKPYYYNSVVDMKADTKLKAGDMAITLGYYSINDGGGGTYQIVKDDTLVDDGGSVHDLANGNKAKLITPKEISSIVFGDSISENEDDTDFLQHLFDYSAIQNVRIKLVQNKIYHITGQIEVNSNLYLDMNGATIRLNDDSNTCILKNMQNYHGNVNKIKNITIKNGTFNGNSTHNFNDNLASMVLVLYFGDNILFENLEINDCQRNPFNIYDTSNITFKNISFDHICNNVARYISGGNYCISMENRLNANEKGSNCIIDNVAVQNSGGHFLHCRNYTELSLKDLKIENVIENANLSDVALTFTNAKRCIVSNCYIERANKNFCEINQGCENIHLSDIKVVSCKEGLILGANGDLESTNKNIYVDNLDITAENYALTINYSDEIYINNSNIIGGLGGSDNNTSNVNMTNCDITMEDTTKKYLMRATKLLNCKINDILFNFYNVNNGNVDIKVPFEIEAASTLNLSISLLANLKGIQAFDLTIASYNSTSPEQNYQGRYIYTRSSKSSDIGKLSQLITELGNNYRKVIVSVTTRDQLDLSTTSDINLKGYLSLRS